MTREGGATSRLPKAGAKSSNAEPGTRMPFTPKPAYSSSARPPLSPRKHSGLLTKLALMLTAVYFSRKEQQGPPLPSPTQPQASSREGRDSEGRSADAPSDIPARGWRSILVRTFKEFNEDRILSEAAGVTFYALLAIFPAVAAFVSVYALFLDPATIAAHVTAAGSFLPGGATDVIGGQVTRIAAHGASTLGVSFLVGLATALWSASAGMKALMGALNIVYDEKEKRGFFKLAGVALALTIGAMGVYRACRDHRRRRSDYP